MPDSQIFKTAVKLPPEQRHAYLDKACRNNHELRQEVESLLRASDADDSFLEKPAADPNVPSPTVDLQPITEAAGSRIGPYKLLQQIGEGGMGVVYLAEQQEPVRRKVALKIIKPGMDSGQVVARFEAERQALAMMEHQNIARVLDAGATETGRPYFVMELVKGIPITEYCDRNQLTPRERLELFVPVCHAVQHAHQKGIIHRDLKPSNVLVCLYDGQPTPKVIDFGVAKATEQRLTEKTMFTQHGQIIGTLEYMSPEQAEMSQLDVDTRSDIYSLGVLLYELLTGSTPITKEQFREAGFAEMLRLIHEQEAVRPSTRLSESGDALPTISAQRSTEPKKLSLLLRGELDWIVMKALEKDRTRRYDSASAFAADVERHLHDEAVEACPPSTWYTLKKLARRNRAAIGMAATIFGILVAATVFSASWGMRAHTANKAAEINLSRATHFAEEASAERDRTEVARRQAESERDRALLAEQQSQDTLVRSLFEQARAVRLTDQPGRRWQALGLLQRAEKLRGRNRPATATTDAEASFPLSEDLPKQTQLRSEAVASLLRQDGRVVREWSGIAHSVSPDGRFAASVVIDMEQETGAVVITDLANEKEVSKWEGADAEKMAGMAIALGPQAKRLASISMNMRQANVWELPECKLLRKLSLPKPAAEAPSDPPTNGNELRALMPLEILRSVSFSPNGRFVAVVAAAHPARVVVWDLQNESDGRVAGKLSHPLDNVSFSPDSRLLAFASARRKVTLWNLAEQRLDKELELPLALAGSHGFTPQGQLAIRCYGSSETRENQAPVAKIMLVWDVDTDKEVRRITLDTSDPFGRISISPDGTRAAVADFNGQIAVYGIGEAVIPVKLDHGAQVQLLEWSHEGRHLLAGGIGALTMWEFADAVPLQRLSLKFDSQQGRIGMFAFSPDGRYLAVERRPRKEITLFDPTSGKKIRNLASKETPPSSPQRLIFSPDSAQLVRLGVKGLIGWDVETGEQRIRTQSTVLKRAAFLSVGVRADGRIVIGGRSDHKPMALIAGEDSPIWRGDGRGGLTVVSPDGRLVTAFNPGLVALKNPSVVYDLSTGEQKFQLSGSLNEATQPIGDFSPDSRWLLMVEMNPIASAGISAVAHSFGLGRYGLSNMGMGVQEQQWSGGIWNVETGEKHFEVAGAANPTAYAFSPDGRYLAVAMRNGSIRLWNVDAKVEMFEWKPLAEKQSEKMAINNIAFTADGTSLVVPDVISSGLQMLDLSRLEKSLAEYELGW